MRLISLITMFALTLGLRLSPGAPRVPGEILAYGPVRFDSVWLLAPEHLYLTRNEGGAWLDITPIGDGGQLLAADFLDTGAGWLVAGHPAGEDRSVLTLARTTDFGAQWSQAPLSLFSPADPDRTIARVELDFTGPTDGLLRVRHVSSSNFERWSAWRTADGGETWTRADELATSSSQADAYILDSAPRGRFLADHQNGWKVDLTGECKPSGSSRICRQSTALLVTHNGGKTWAGVPLPDGVRGGREWSVPDAVAATSASAGAGATPALSGQGFDKCEVPTLAQFQEWRWTSPYSAVNLYIGGSLRACRNAALSASYLRSVYNIGWLFIPTWVGPQAPSNGFSSKISLDPAVAQGQGWAEASSASDTLVRLGLTEAGGTGSIVYYDLEYYNTGDAAVNEAVGAFMNGWISGLHARGHLAGVYGTGPALRPLANFAPPPDAIWAAHWINDSYDPAATVWDVYGLSNDVWVNHQRLRQYTGGHTEPWGSVYMNIDSNAIDGPVAGPPRNFTIKSRMYLPFVVR